MNWIKRFFSGKTEPQPHNFSKVMQNKECCVAFLSGDFYEDYEIISCLAGWNDIFKSIVVFTVAQNFEFQRRLQNTGNISFRIFSPEQPLFKESLILNFSASKEIRRYLSRNHDSSIADIHNQSNLQFLPQPQNARELMTKSAQFYGISLQKKQLAIELSEAEKESIKGKFIQNRFQNFVFDCDDKFPVKLMENHVISFKQNFSANVYLTDKTFVSKELINIEVMPVHNLFELFSLVSGSDLFVTSKTSLAKLLGELGYFTILLGEQTGVKNVVSVHPKELFVMKNVIRQHLTEKKEMPFPA